MELIQIIYDILIFGTALLFVVVIISFIISRKNKANDIANKEDGIDQSHGNSTEKPNSDLDQQFRRKNQLNSNLQIFRINQHRPKEVKIVRKPTIIERDTQEKIRNDESPAKKTSGDKKRYTIVNDEMKKNSSNVANFYL